MYPLNLKKYTRPFRTGAQVSRSSFIDRLKLYKEKKERERKREREEQEKKTAFPDKYTLTTPFEISLTAAFLITYYIISRCLFLMNVHILTLPYKRLIWSGLNW